jgi:hypothetical protein
MVPDSLFKFDCRSLASKPSTKMGNVHLDTSLKQWAQVLTWTTGASSEPTAKSEADQKMLSSLHRSSVS